jgi:hypothetical protein
MSPNSLYTYARLISKLGYTVTDGIDPDYGAYIEVATSRTPYRIYADKTDAQQIDVIITNLAELEHYRRNGAK